MQNHLYCHNKNSWNVDYACTSLFVVFIFEISAKTLLHYGYMQPQQRDGGASRQRADTRLLKQIPSRFTHATKPQAQKCYKSQLQGSESEIQWSKLSRTVIFHIFRGRYMIRKIANNKKPKLRQRVQFPKTPSYLFRLFRRLALAFLVFFMCDTLLSYSLLDLSKCSIPLVFSFLQSFLLSLDNLEELRFCFADQILSLFLLSLVMCFLSRLQSWGNTLKRLASGNLSERFLFTFQNSMHAYEVYEHWLNRAVKMYDRV